MVVTQRTTMLDLSVTTSHSVLKQMTMVQQVDHLPYLRRQLTALSILTMLVQVAQDLVLVLLRLQKESLTQLRIAKNSLQ